MSRFSSSLSRSRLRGFTLAELMMVLVVIGLLVAVIYPASANYLARSRDADRKADLSSAAVTMSNYFRDFRMYPAADADGCLDPNSLSNVYGYQTIQLPTSPKNSQYDEGCGSNGRYGYGTGAASYIISARTEMPYGGNYSGSTEGMVGNITYTGWTNANNPTLRYDRAGNIFLMSDGIWMDGIEYTPVTYQGCRYNDINYPDGATFTGYAASSVPFGQSCAEVEAKCVDGVYSPSTLSPNCTVEPGRSCGAGSGSGYDWPVMAHMGTWEVTKTTTGAPPNGFTEYTATATCNNGTVTIGGETSFINCNTGYTLSGTTCAPIPNNCAPATQSGYTWTTAINHWSSQPVTKTSTGAPPNGFTEYTATATCTNGTVTIGGETSSIDCDAGYTWSGTTCAPNTQNAACTGLPQNASWNTASGITQTLVAGPWTPSATGSYNTTPSTTNCHYKCNDGYTWNGSACIVVPGFTTVWNVGMAGYGDGNNTISFNIESTGPVTIDWGDGTTDSGTTGTVSHTYATAGDKTVKISGPLTRFYNPSYDDHSSFWKLTSVMDWGNMQWTDMGYMFSYANRLVSVPAIAPNISNVTNMSHMFNTASSFNQPLNSWDVSNVTDMSSMFNTASSFNQPLDNWNVSNVTNMSYMFRNASSFNWNIESWDVSNVMYMEGMFWNASSFNQPLNSWNVSNVTDMVYMFYGASSFNWNIGSWDVSNVTRMDGMFWGASSFNQPLDNWNVSKVTEMGGMFWNASSFNQPLNSWNVSNVTDMSYMFLSASSFNQPLDNWNVSNVTNMSYMFYGASSFNWNIGSWDVPNVTNMSYMFNNASSFNQNIHSWCVPLIASKPVNFDTNASMGFINNASVQPRWGCSTIRQAACGGSLPANATATTASTFTQNFVNGVWTPASVNWTRGATTCGFNCNAGYDWTGTACVKTPTGMTYYESALCGNNSGGWFSPDRPRTTVMAAVADCQTNYNTSYLSVSSGYPTFPNFSTIYGGWTNPWGIRYSCKDSGFVCYSPTPAPSSMSVACQTVTGTFNTAFQSRHTFQKCDGAYNGTAYYRCCIPK